MSGRRSHVRYGVIQPPEGVLRVMQDVLLQTAGQKEMVAISREAGIVGEAVTLGVSAGERTHRVPVRVVDSQPIIVDGSVRHRLRLEAVGGAS
jgi:hypothetical protein